MSKVFPLPPHQSYQTFQSDRIDRSDGRPLGTGKYYRHGMAGCLLRLGLVIVLGAFVIAIYPLGAAEIPTNAYDERVLRDPFWPISYRPAELALSEQSGLEGGLSSKGLAGKWENAQTRLVISGVGELGKGESFAIVNGETVEVGDKVSAEYEGEEYSWQVESIETTGIRLKRLEVHPVK